MNIYTFFFLIFVLIICFLLTTSKYEEHYSFDRNCHDFDLSINGCINNPYCNYFGCIGPKDGSLCNYITNKHDCDKVIPYLNCKWMGCKNK